MNRFLLLLSCVLVAYKSYPQNKSVDCKRCNISIVREVEADIEKLSDTQLKLFLCSFGDSCSNNIEFSEYSNKVLFDVLQNYPEKMIRVLGQDSNLDLAYLFSVLSSPLSDYDLDLIYKKVESCRGSEDIKRNILKSIEIAKNRQ